MTVTRARVAILVENGYEDLELWYPLLRLKEETLEVVVVGPRRGAYESKNGYPVEADIGIDGASAEDFDAVIIPGGYAPDRMRRSRPMVDFVRDADAKGRIVAAICHAGWMLTSADIVRNRKVTGFFSIKDDLVHAGAEYLDQEVVKDGNLITSRTPNDLPAFCHAIISALVVERRS